MKRYLLGCAFLAGFLLISRESKAANYSIANDSATCVTISVSNSAATETDTPSLGGRKSLNVQNLSAASHLYCGFDPAQVSVGHGHYINIVPDSWSIDMAEVRVDSGTNLGVYCINDGGGSVNAECCQVR